jgi:hypothetical protein
MDRRGKRLSELLTETQVLGHRLAASAQGSKALLSPILSHCCTENESDVLHRDDLGPGSGDNEPIAELAGRFADRLDRYNRLGHHLEVEFNTLIQEARDSIKAYSLHQASIGGLRDCDEITDGSTDRVSLSD